MIFSRMKIGLNLFTTSVRYLIGNPVLLLLPFAIIFMMIVMIVVLVLLLIVGVPIPIDDIMVPTTPFSDHALSNFIACWFGAFIIFSLRIYVIHRLMLPFIGKKSSLSKGNVGRTRTILLLIVLITINTMMAIPILFLQDLAKGLYALLLFVLSFFSWPLVPFLLQAKHSLSELMLIAQKMLPEAFCGLIIFNSIAWGTYGIEFGVVGTAVKLYLQCLFVVLDAVFVLVLYRYYLENKLDKAPQN